MIEEETSAEIMNGQDQVEMIAPLNSNADYGDENQRTALARGNNIPDHTEGDQDSLFGSHSDQEDFADHTHTILEWISQEPTNQLEQHAGRVPRTQPSGNNNVPDHTDQEDPFGTASDQESFEDHVLTINE